MTPALQAGSITPPFSMKPLLCLLLLATSRRRSPKPPARPRRKPKPPQLPAYAPSVPEPTLRGVSYGTHERHILDFWKAESATPAPLVFVIHGGGWQGGEKERVDRFVDVSALLKAGLSVAAINYRFVKMAEEEGVKPPVKMPLHDAPAPCSSCAARRPNGTSTRTASGPPGVPPEPAPACGSPFTTISPCPEATIRRPRILPSPMCRRHRSPDHARSAADEGMDAEQPLRRPCLRRGRVPGLPRSPRGRRCCRGSPSIRPTRSSARTIRRSI